MLTPSINPQNLPRKPHFHLLKNSHLFSSPSIQMEFTQFSKKLQDQVLMVLNSDDTKPMEPFLIGSVEDRAQKHMCKLIKLAIEEPRMLNHRVNGLVCEMISIFEARVLKIETRNYSIQFLMRVLEAKDLALALQVLDSDVVYRLFNVAMRMLLGLRDDGDTLCESREDDQAGNYGCGIKMLKQMSIVFGVVPIAFELLPIYVNEIEWRKWHAWITMLGVMSEQFSDEIMLMEDYLKQAVDVIKKSFLDSRLEVCSAAFHFMQLDTDLVHVMQLMHHPRILPALITALDKNQSPIVVEEVVSAMLLIMQKKSQTLSIIDPYVDIIFRKLILILEFNNSTKRCRTITICIFNTLVAQLPAVCPEHCVHFLPQILEACTDADSELGKEATHAVRVCAEFGGSNFKPFMRNDVIKLVTVIGCPNQCNEDIAVCAFGKIFEFHREMIDAAKLIPSWLNCLPIKNDLIEAKDVLHQLYLMVERLDREIFGANCENLLKTVAVFLEVISDVTNLGTQQTVNKMKDLLKLIWRTLPHTHLYRVFLSLTAKQRYVLSSIN